MADRLYKGPFDEDMRLVDMGDGTFAQRTEAHPPVKLMTDGNTATGVFKARWEERP